MPMSGVNLFAGRLRVGGTGTPAAPSSRAAWAKAMVGSTSGKTYCGGLDMACSPRAGMNASRKIIAAKYGRLVARRSRFKIFAQLSRCIPIVKISGFVGLEVLASWSMFLFIMGLRDGALIQFAPPGALN